MKKKLQAQQTQTENLIEKLYEKMDALLEKMYKNPDKAFDELAKASRGERLIESAIDKLIDKPGSLGTPVIGRYFKPDVEANKQFDRDKDELAEVLGEISKKQDSLKYIESGLKEIDLYENQDREKPVKETAMQYAQRVGREQERRDEKKEVGEGKQQLAYSAEREANRATITPQEVREIRETHESKKHRGELVEPQAKKEPRATPEQFAWEVKKEERLADERVGAEQGKPNKAEKDNDLSEDPKAKIKKEMEQARRRHELERDDDDLER